MIVDAHVHITPDGKWFNTDYNASLVSLVSELEMASIDKAVLLPIEGFISNDFIVESCRKYPDRLIGFASVNPLQCQKAIRELECYVTQFGLRGLKLHPRLQGFHPLSKGVISLLSKAVELGIPIIFDTFPRGGYLPIKDTLPLVYDELSRIVPEAKIILAHSGGHRVLDAMAVAKSNPNVYLGISFCISYYWNSSVIKDLLFAIRKVGAHRVIYGSDYPEMRIASYYVKATELLASLSKEEKDLIFGDNISSLLKLEN